DILQRQAQQGWGAKAIDRLTSELRRAFPAMKGMSPRNFKYMRALAVAFPDPAFVQEVLAQITWHDAITIVEKVKEPTTRDWYVRKTKGEDPAEGHAAAMQKKWESRVRILAMVLTPFSFQTSPTPHVSCRRPIQ